MKLEALSIADLKQGYAADPDSGSYSCATCGKTYEAGEIYPIGGRFFKAERAIRLHMELTHGDYLHHLIHSDSKYNTLTENQRQLLGLFAVGMADKETARELGVSTSTVRHQKFIFREKAKQAKLYLAVYESVFENKSAGGNAIVPIHDHAKMVDERYVVTGQEKEHILQTAFSSLEPLKLKAFSPKEKKKIVILSKIAEQFQQDQNYSEGEVNQILGSIYDDFATLRRYMIEYGFMKRTPDGSRYWRT